MMRAGKHVSSEQTRPDQGVICRYLPAVVLVLLLILPVFASYSQYFTTGEDPAKLRWRQLSTPHFRLIYPCEWEKNAPRMAWNLERVYQAGGVTLDHQPGQVPIVFHTRNVRSNGLVGLAPRRMELFTPPHQEMYAQDWLEQLALHEFRHVVQTGKIASQLPGVLKAFLGEQAIALVTGLYLPFWFLEGDAVVAETALSSRGRGRQPSFLMEHKAQVTGKGVFSLSKAYHGSYRDFVPDHYALGYHLVGESRARYGSILWSNAVDRVARCPLSLNPLSKSLRMQTGMNQNQLYRMLFDSLQNEWSREISTLQTAGTPLTPQTDCYTNYRYNHILPDGSILSLKSGFDQIPRIVKLDSQGGEETVTIPGQLFGESVGYRNYLVAWSEFVPDIRWSHGGKSYIRIYDTRNRILNTIKPDYKSLAPSISPDEHNVAVVEADYANNYSLALYSKDGELVTRYRSPANEYFFSPCWQDDSTLLAVVLTHAGKRIAMVRPWRGEMRVLQDEEMGEIRQLAYRNNRIYFIGGITGRDELYSMDPAAGSIRREMEGRFGLDSPAFWPTGDSLVISDYTSEGYRLVGASLARHPVAFSELEKESYPLATLLATQESGVVDFTPADSLSFRSKSYRKAGHLFNFHSWAPLSLEINPLDVMPGVSLLSQNLLSTNVTSLGYKWIRSEKEGEFYMNMEYLGLFPVVKGGVTAGRRSSSYGKITEYLDPLGTVVRRDTAWRPYSWDQYSVKGSLRLPLQLSRGAGLRLLQPGLAYEYTRFNPVNVPPGLMEKGSVQALAWRLYYHHLERPSYRDLQSPWGLVLDATYRHSPFGNSGAGNLSAFQLITYWPGLLRHHGISAYCGFQKRHPGEYPFNDAIRYPRGWHSTDNRRFLSGSVTYSLPLLYPDLAVGKWVYFKRIKSSLFCDYGHLTGEMVQDGEAPSPFDAKMSTVGIDLSADLHLFRFYAPVNAGIRSLYQPGPDKFLFELLFSVDFNSF